MTYLEKERADRGFNELYWC